MAAQLAGQARLLRSGGAQFVHLGGMCVESLPLELKAELSTSASLLGAAPPATHAPFHPAYIPVVPASAPPERKTPVRIRLDLQQRAATNLRRHMLRALRRFSVLVVADLGSFYLMRELVRTVREYAWLGDRVAARVGDALPPGIFEPWFGIMLARTVMAAAGALPSHVECGSRFSCCRHPCRCDTGQRCSDHGEQNSGREHKPVHAGPANQGNIGGKPADEQPNGHGREIEAQPRCGERDHQGLDQELLGDPDPARAERRTDHDFMLPCESAGQQQRRHIAARDYQHQHGRERQPQHDASGSPEDVRTQRHDVRVPVSIGDGKFGCDRAGNDVHLRLRLLDGDARAQFRDDVERPVVASFILLWEQRLPEIDPVVDVAENACRP